MAERPLLLVLCTGNSCRSQMAEGFLRRAAGDRYAVASAGSRPAETVHPLTVTVMQEVGIDLSEARPKPARDFERRDVDTVITVCDDAAESCPVFRGDARRLHWPFEDPAAFEGPDDARLTKFRQVRDEIAARVERWLAAEASL